MEIQDVKKIESWLGDGDSREGYQYVLCHQKLVFFFQNRGLGEFAEEMADQVLDIIAEKIKVVGREYVIESTDGLVEHKMAYVIGIARRRHFPQRPPQPTPEVHPDDSLDQIREHCRRSCLQEYADRHKSSWKLLKDYYPGGRLTAKEHREKLADRLGMSTNALAIKIHRTVTAWKPEFYRCVDDCVSKKRKESRDYL